MLAKSIEIVSAACKNANSRYHWQPCTGMFRRNGKIQGAVCETETGRIYIEADTEEPGPRGKIYFYVWVVSGENNPYCDNCKHVSDRGWLYKYTWEEAIEAAENRCKGSNMTNRAAINITDWNDVAALDRLMDEHGNSKFPFFGTNEDGEDVVLHINNDSILLVTYQSNGWVRKNYYYRGEYRREELFDGKWR